MPARAPRNRTLSCTDAEIARLSRGITRVESPVGVGDIEGRVVAGDIFQVAKFLPSAFADLLILDPPYNLTKTFNGARFAKKDADAYRSWFGRLVEALAPTTKPDATIYVCSDWRTSMLIAPILDSHFRVRNRITWERGKGRGAKSNWKNDSEDVWFCTRSDRYRFDVDAVKLKRKVLAPYTADGRPKDWRREEMGDFRLTHPSNVWTDVTVPFWSMPENTDHPTQKPEKLIAKLILASSEAGDFVFDPFLGSGATAAVAEKLRRRWCGVEIDETYLCWALKRVAAAKRDRRIQGYADGVFWERNARPAGRMKSAGGEARAALLP